MNRNACAFLAVAGPLVVGVLNAPSIQAQSTQAQSTPAATPKFEVASIRPCESAPAGAGTRSGGIGVSPGRLRVSCVSVRFMIQIAYVPDANSKLIFAIDPNGVAPVEGGPAWMKSDGCGYFGTTANYYKNQTIRMIRPLHDGRLEPGYANNPGFLRSVGLGLGQFGLIPEGSLRELFETAEQRLELSILPGGSLV